MLRLSLSAPRSSRTQEGSGSCHGSRGSPCMGNLMNVPRQTDGLRGAGLGADMGSGLWGGEQGTLVAVGLCGDCGVVMDGIRAGEELCWASASTG